MKKFLRQVHEIYKPLQFKMLGVLGFIAASQALNLISPYIHSLVIDGLVNRLPTRQILALAAAALAVNLFRGVILRWFRERYELDHIDFSIPERTREVTLKKMFRFSIGQHTSEHSGIKQRVADRGEDALKNMVDLLLFQVTPLTAEITIMTGVLLYWSTSMGLIVAVCIAAHATFVWQLNKTFKNEFKKMDKNFIKDAYFKGEVVSNIGLVITQGQEDKALAECEESFTKASEYAKRFWKRFVTFAVIRDTIPTIGRFSVLFVSIYGVAEGRYTIGELVMFTSWTGSALSNLGELSPLQRRLIQLYTSVRRYFDMLDIPPEVTEIPNPVHPEKFLGQIEFKGVSFRYTRRDQSEYLKDDEDDEEIKHEEVLDVGPALDDVSFVIEAGQTVAFVGESGAGKSTLVQALIRAKDPEKGQIIVDGNDLRLIDLKHYRHSIGVVSQDVVLFDRTLRDNITYGLNGQREKIGDHELWEVAQMSCIDRFWPRLEKGFDTLIGERGVKLSGGERQRVGIARALIKNPDILIFDEATSNLDSENEGLIQQSIELAATGRTTIVIAHRFSTIRKVDKIFVFDKGKLVGQGKHNELAFNCEPYIRLLQNQKI